MKDPLYKWLLPILAVTAAVVTNAWSTPMMTSLALADDKADDKGIHGSSRMAG